MNRFIVSAAALLGLCVAAPQAMATAVFSCEDLHGGHWCAAYDQGPGYQYFWETSGNLSLEWSNDHTVPFKTITCITDYDGGYVWLTVVRPGQPSLQGQTWLRCRGAGGWPFEK